MNQVELPKDPNYHFMPDMTNQAIRWVQYQKSPTPDKPFFVYVAPGATHAPHHVPKSWFAKYRGKFDQGWDKVREEMLGRQERLGVAPQERKLAPKPAAIKDWAALSPDERKLFARQMEVCAGQLENTLVPDTSRSSATGRHSRNRAGRSRARTPLVTPGHRARRARTRRPPSSSRDHGSE